MAKNMTPKIVAVNSLISINPGEQIEYRAIITNLVSSQIKVYVNNVYIKTIQAYSSKEVVLYSELASNNKQVSIYIICSSYKSNTIQYSVNVNNENNVDTRYIINNIYGTKDCTSYLQSELKKAKSGGYTKVIFNEGTYYTRNLSLESGLTYEGLGKVVIKSHSSCIVWDCSVRTINGSNITVKNIEFDGNKENVSGNTEEGVTNLRFEISNNIIVDGCKFYNNYYLSTLWYGCTNVEIKNSSFASSDVGACFMRQPSSNVLIHDNNIDGTDGTSEGIAMYDCDSGQHKYIKIYNNTITNKKYGHGIHIIQTNTLEIYNNIIINCGTNIFLGPNRENDIFISENILIYGNTCTSGTWNSIDCSRCNKVDVYNNSIINASESAFSSENASNITFRTNLINNFNTNNPGQHGVFAFNIYSSTNIMILGNNISCNVKFDAFINVYGTKTRPSSNTIIKDNVYNTSNVDKYQTNYGYGGNVIIS